MKTPFKLREGYLIGQRQRKGKRNFLFAKWTSCHRKKATTMILLHLGVRNQGKYVNWCGRKVNWRIWKQNWTRPIWKDLAKSSVVQVHVWPEPKSHLYGLAPPMALVGQFVPNNWTERFLRIDIILENTIKTFIVLGKLYACFHL